MNEEQWLTATAPYAGLDYLCGAGVSAHRRKAGRRKLRLFLCACSRRVWDLVPEGPHRRAVELGERICEGEDVAARVASLGDLEVRGSLARRHAAHAATACVRTSIFHAAVGGAAVAAMAAGWARLEAEGGQDMRTYERGKADEQLAQAALLREVFGNPFRPLKLAPAWLRWRDHTLAAMARSIYLERAFDRLPVLADALTDAGCDDEEILAHCRSEGPHVRGCWLVDLLLGVPAAA